MWYLWVILWKSGIIWLDFLIPLACIPTLKTPRHNNANIYSVVCLQEFKGAAKLYFTHYVCVVIILFNTGWFKPVTSTYFFAKLLSHTLLCLFCFFEFWCRLNKTSKCHLWFCSYFIKAICKFVKTWSRIVGFLQSVDRR